MNYKEEVLHNFEVYCKSCEFFKGHCLKGKPLSAPSGCPVKKFKPVVGDYHKDTSVEQVPCKTCGGLANPTWSQVLADLSYNLKVWAKSGAPLATKEEHTARTDKCNGCPSRKGYLCGECKCIIYVKAKLATSECPLRKW